MRRLHPGAFKLAENGVRFQLVGSTLSIGRSSIFKCDKEQNEVAIVVENQDGQVIGLEIKSSASVGTSDFNGMRKLAAACGSRFSLGLVLYNHEQIVPFGERLFAAPLSSLWA